MRLQAKVLTVTAVLAVTTTAAQAGCALRDVVVEKLKTKYAEQLTAGGLHSSQSRTAVVEVWASPETGTFTVMLTNPNGISCIMASGTDWFDHEVKAIPKGTAS